MKAEEFAEGMKRLLDVAKERFVNLCKENDIDPKSSIFDETGDSIMTNEIGGDLNNENIMPTPEGGTPPVEGGMPPVEGGMPPVEGGMPPVEGGMPPMEGGMPPMEGGMPPMEGGMPNDEQQQQPQM